MITFPCGHVGDFTKSERDINADKASNANPTNFVFIQKDQGWNKFRKSNYHYYSTSKINLFQKSLIQN